jgi:signal transduction histidine kinase
MAEMRQIQKIQPSGRIKGRNRRNLMFLAALVLFVSGMISGGRHGEEGYSRRIAARFEKVLHIKEEILNREFANLEAAFSGADPLEVLEGRSSRYQELSKRRGITIYFFREGVLQYWSDHSVPIPESWSPRLNKPFVSFRNADYVTHFRQVEQGRLVGLIEVGTHYPVENKFLVNKFQGEFRTGPEIGIEFLEDDGKPPVLNSEGTYLFSLDCSKALEGGKGIGRFARLSFLLAWLLVTGGLFLATGDARGRERWLWMAVTGLFLSAGTILLLRYGVHHLFENTNLFAPDLFANRYFPSLGHLLLATGAMVAAVSYFYLYWMQDREGSRRYRLIHSLPLFMLTALLLWTLERVIASLVLDSGISFEAYRVTSFSGYTVVGLLVILAWFVSIGLLLDRAIVCLDRPPLRTLLLGMASASPVYLLAVLLQGGSASLSGLAGMVFLLAGNLYLRYRQPGRLPFSRFIFLLLSLSVIMVIRLQQSNHIKVERQKEVELVKLASEHDPVAEMLFSELSMAIRNDSLLAGFMNQPFIDIEPLINHLRRSYFSGYWTKYDLQITVCRPDDRVYLEPPDDEWRHCYTFFEELIRTRGMEVPETDFHYLDNHNGRISYIAAIPYFRAEPEHRVFIELDSKILSEELGYPELLLDADLSALRLREFSYARYNQGSLITQDGEFPYRRSPEFYTSGEATFEKLSFDGWDHTIYNVDRENTLIVGSPSVTTVDHLISFSYVFAFNFLVLALLYLLYSIRMLPGGLNWSFKNRIQYSMAGILFLTFALICSGTIGFIIRQYREKNNENLRNTMRSVYIELIHKVEYETGIRNWSSDDYYNLDELLRKFSNVFYTDINLYDEEGGLMATSRSEIFDRQLLSRRMNRQAFESLAGGKASEFIHEERVGGLKFISAYVPLLNSNNKFLAYLNLPYFTQSGALTRDVTNMVVAVINIYLFLLLIFLGASVLIADRITQPLRMIQSRIAQVSLSSKNEMIRYERSDEIRGLVEEYNFMVQELERSAELLAQSEREAAWREMAKQIAHEIKNPLTPMKLNVQHLQRIIAEGKDDPEIVSRISDILIEQIDSLSTIANEFSDFAKMPRARNVRINLVIQLKNLLQLFETTEKTEISLDVGKLKRLYVYADREQLMRVFINLVKNGLQSIPETRQGHIRIKLDVTSERQALVTVSDNGKGIPEEIRDKLFQPNFTTKSSGMGMGLAISSNIIRAMGGKIWFESVIDRGTTFLLELPLMDEKPVHTQAGG